MKFEVRMTACNRPQMLRRALQSLRAQIYPHWSAIVYDDSTDDESQAVVAAIRDDRIIYKRNPHRLGAVKNVDQCLAPSPVFGGDFGCLLEDDNFWFPSFLSSVVDKLQRGSWNIVQTNQRYNDEDRGLHPAHETTRGDWFAAGPVQPIDLRAVLLFMEGVSNSGLVWRLGRKTDLRLGDTVAEAALNEFCRSLLIGEPLLFIDEPQGAYTIIERSQSARATDRQRVVSRGMQSVRDYILRMHRDSVLPIARRLAERRGLADRLAQTLSYSGHPLLAWSSASGCERLIGRSLAKGLAVRLVEKDPCAAFLASGRVPTIAGSTAN